MSRNQSNKRRTSGGNVTGLKSRRGPHNRHLGRMMAARGSRLSRLRRPLHAAACDHINCESTSVFSGFICGLRRLGLQR